MRSVYDGNCIAAIYGLLQGSIANSSSVEIKREDESTYNFMQRVVGMHSGMKVSCDLEGGTYLVVRGLAASVHDSGYALQFGRDEYDVASQCVVSWKTDCGNYSTVHMYKLSDLMIDKDVFERCVN